MEAVSRKTPILSIRRAIFLMIDVADLLALPRRYAGLTEISVNPDGQVFIEVSGEPMRVIGTIAADKVRYFINLQADRVGKVVNEDTPTLDTETEDGCRLHAAIPPIVSAPILAIRVPSSKTYSLKDLVDLGTITDRQSSVLSAAIVGRRNIVVAGGTGSGKTTLTNTLLLEMSDLCPDDRVIINEDLPEIQCAAKNLVKQNTRDNYNLNSLVRDSLRMRPDRILIGEVRGQEALEVLKAWNTGHPGGICTIHANSAEAVFSRLEQLVMEVSANPMEDLIGEAVDVIVYIEKRRKKREVTEILLVHQYKNGRYQFEKSPN